MYDKSKHIIVTGTKTTKKGNITQGKFYCITNGKTYETLGGLRNGIRPTGLTVKEYYDTYYRSNDEGYCIACGTETSFSDVVEGYKEFCGNDKSACHNKRPEKRKAVSERFENNPEALDNFLKLQKEWRENLTDEEKFAMREKHLAAIARTKERDPDFYIKHMKRSHQIWNEIVKEDPEKMRIKVRKTLATKKRNGSFRNGMTGRVSELVYRGQTYKYQGYEDMFIKMLVDRNVDFKSRGDVPHVVMPERPSKKYVPDFYIEDVNLLIDVKSERTIRLSEDQLILKQRRAFEQGYNFIYFVIHSRKICDDRIMCLEDVNEYERFVNTLISSQALIDEGRFNDYPVVGSTLQAIGSGSAGGPTFLDRDIV